MTAMRKSVRWLRNLYYLIGVEYRQDGPWNISVARRRSVAILDEFIGPKR